jgi:hypothetical protein
MLVLQGCICDLAFPRFEVGGGCAEPEEEFVLLVLDSSFGVIKHDNSLPRNKYFAAKSLRVSISTTFLPPTLTISQIFL